MITSSTDGVFVGQDVTIVGFTWNTDTPLAVNTQWLPEIRQPLFKNPSRQTAGETKPRSIPPLDLLDIDWIPLTNQPLFKLGPRQTAGMVWSGFTPAPVFVPSQIEQPASRLAPRQTAGMSMQELPIPLVVPDFLYRQEAQIVRRVPRVPIQIAYFSRIPIGESRPTIADLILDETPEETLEVTPLTEDLKLDATPEETLEVTPLSEDLDLDDATVTMEC